MGEWGRTCVRKQSIQDLILSRSAEYKGALLRAQCKVISRQVPLMHLLCIVNICALSFTTFSDAPLALSLYCPLILTMLCASQALWWLKLGAGVPAVEDAELALVRTGRFSGLITLALCAWALAVFPHGDAYGQSHVVFFMAITIIGSVSCLTHLLPAAIVVGLVANAVFLAFLVPSGNTVFLTMSLNVVFVSGAFLLVLAGNYREFSSQVEAQLRTEALGRENQRLANIDSLTHLPNRRSFFARLSAECAAASAKQSRLAVAMLDLDGFKAVNDLYGHATGDSLLVEVGRRLEKACPDDAFLARLGGDEYAMIVANAHEADLLRLGERICEEIAAPYVLDGISVLISVSVGFAVYPDHAAEPDLVFEYADYALYEAKQNKTGRTVLFCKEHSFALLRNARIEQALRDADLRAEIAVAFQPIIDLETGRVASFEALSRWESRELGDVSPAQFIPIAEKAGLVSELTRVLLEQSLCAAQQWPEPLRLSFNLSPKDICSAGGALRIANIVLKSGFDPRRIDFEITETAMMHDFPHARQAVEALKALGCGISLDDFGTGYSSLAQLQTLPITKLKIDRCFVADLQEQTTGYKIVKSMLSLARDMGIDCIVEGVETEEELRTLRQLGCRLVQGFHMSKPLDQEAARRYVGAILIEPGKVSA
ncbi:EAL domain-containing protein (plasmid) [Sinorhizobium fredii]|nr:EAL domain-containing protein [Sinorhizobium fredii]